MQEASHGGLPLTFPREYRQKFEEYRKRRVESLEKPRRLKKPTSSMENVFSSNCKQAITLSNKAYCCVLKELVNRSLCKGCPCYEHEPIEYSLFRRV